VSERIQGRFFLVGCARSGTTLLQTLLAGHPRVASFPESHFFPGTIHLRRWFRKAGLAPWRARSRLLVFLREAGLDEERWRLPRTALFVRQYVKVFLKILDAHARKLGKTHWLEKTPQHLHYIAEIERLVPRARFIHLVRQGADVVASLYEVTHRHPETWGGATDIDACIDRWLGDVAITRRHLGRPAHTMVRYEALVRDPAAVLVRLCDFMGLSYDPAMLDRQADAARQVVLAGEPWKAAAGEAVREAGERKFETLFNEEERRYIEAHLSGVDLEEVAPADPAGAS
jgi:hypothetical protein